MKKRSSLVFCLLLFFSFLEAQIPPPLKDTYVDLVISDYRVTSISSQEAKYTCTITNNSGIPGGGNAMYSGRLALGKSVMRLFAATGDFTSYKLCSLTLDPSNKIRESNEKNNIRFATTP